MRADGRNGAPWRKTSTKIVRIPGDMLGFRGSAQFAIQLLPHGDWTLVTRAKPSDDWQVYEGNVGPQLFTSLDRLAYPR